MTKKESTRDTKKEHKVLPFNDDNYKKWSNLVISKSIEKGWGKVLFNRSFDNFNLKPENFYAELGEDGTTAITEAER